MPSVKGIPGPYRFFFYSFDCLEPEHTHVKRENMLCKFWLEPVVLASNDGFSPRELNQIRGLVVKYRGHLLEAWDEHCGQ